MSGGVSKTPEQIKQCVLLREAGYSVAAISDKTGISPSTVTRHLKKHGIGKGSLSSEAIDTARAELIEDGTLVDKIKAEVISILLDDTAQFKALRSASATILESLINDTEMDAALKSRALSALSTSLLTQQSLIHKTLQIDKYFADQDIDGDLPSLEIRRMTSTEVDKAVELAGKEFVI